MAIRNPACGTKACPVGAGKMQDRCALAGSQRITQPEHWPSHRADPLTPTTQPAMATDDGYAEPPAAEYTSWVERPRRRQVTLRRPSMSRSKCHTLEIPAAQRSAHKPGKHPSTREATRQLRAISGPKPCLTSARPELGDVGSHHKRRMRRATTLATANNSPTG